MSILFLIPARSGSKGLPGKNTRVLGPKTLIEYSIDFALENLTEADELCISTNDPLVVEIAMKKGIDIPFIRPDELSNDTANSYDVIMHALNHYETMNKKFDAVLLLQPTSPFRKNEDLQRLFKEFDRDVDMVVSVKIAKENPYFTLFENTSDGFIEKSKSSFFDRRQDIPEVYAFNGSMYLINVNALKKSKLGDFKKIKKITMPEERSVDIDTLADWSLAEFYLKYENG
jgi:N-acylneuraminate cytidylyltransferase